MSFQTRFQKKCEEVHGGHANSQKCVTTGPNQINGLWSTVTQSDAFSVIPGTETRLALVCEQKAVEAAEAPPAALLGDIRQFSNASGDRCCAVLILREDAPPVDVVGAPGLHANLLIQTKTVRDWINRPYGEFSAEFEKRRKLWEALCAYIHGQGAWLISAPGAKYLRIECKQGSALPAKLMELSYSPRHCGTGTRLTPGNTAETIFLPVDVIEITLGK